MTKKTFKFGKIDYNGTGRKINAVTVEVKYDGEKFSASGNIWNSKKTDILCGGQCLDEMYQHLKNNKTFLMIYSLWKQYHLNDMTPGTPKQMAFLSTIKRPCNAEFYTWECEQLEKVNLLIDNLDGKPYKYGTAWLTSEIPSYAKEDINKLLKVA
jgi:hypothetical protein